MSGSELRNWLEVLAFRYQGIVRRVGEAGYAVAGRGDDWKALGFGAEAVVREQPGDAAEWRRRFRLVEQSAALALRAPFQRFSVVLGSGEHGGGEINVLRCAFGWEQVAGPLESQRYTAYQVEPWGVSGWVKGGDLLWAQGAENDNHPGGTNVVSRIEKLEPMLRAAAAHLLVSRPLADLQRQFEAERQRDLRHMESFYFDPAGGRGNLLGAPPEGLSRDLAIEREFRSRVRESFLRHQIRLHCRLLSLGTVRITEIGQRAAGDGPGRLPFTSVELR